MKISTPKALALIVISSGLLWLAGVVLIVSAFVPPLRQVAAYLAAASVAGGFVASVATLRRIMGR